MQSISSELLANFKKCVREEDSSALPEFARLPRHGYERWTGLSRSTLLQLEKDGHIRLRRLRRPGQIRGIVLLPVREICAWLHKNTDANGPTTAGGAQ